MQLVFELCRRTRQLRRKDTQEGQRDSRNEFRLSLDNVNEGVLKQRYLSQTQQLRFGSGLF